MGWHATLTDPNITKIITVPRVSTSSALLQFQVKGEPVTVQDDDVPRPQGHG